MPKFPRSSILPKNNQPTPEIEQPPGDLPKKFPQNPEPLSYDGLEASEKQEASPGNREGSGEDPLVESGLPDNDPERPRQDEIEKSME
jgi:hypothetical protein